MTGTRAPSVQIVQLRAEALHALADGDLARAAEHSPVPLTEWLVSEERISTWRFRSRQALETPQDLPWVTGVLWDPVAEATVGAAGFHGAPDERGMVEVGYGVDPEHRRQGYARAALGVMVERAEADASVTVVRASVGPWNEASRTLVESCGFVEVGEQWDDEDGLELVYELPVR